MTPIEIAWRNLRSRPIQTILTALIVAVGVGLALLVTLAAGGMRRGLLTAGGPFEIVVGPKGSATQLVVSSVLLQDVPLGNVTYAQLNALRADQRVRDAVPIALGDNVRGLRLVGTDGALFKISLTDAAPPFYQIAQGRVFATDAEAVLGSAAAQQLNAGPGAQLISSHGTLSGPNQVEHADPYTVVGVLAETGTPLDRAIFVPLTGYWRVHGSSGGSTVAADGAVTVPDSAAAELGVTAILVRGRDLSAAYQIYQQLNAGRDLQAALPGAVLTQFLDYLGQGERALRVVGYVTLALATVSAALALTGAAAARRRDVAVLRALGAARSTVLAIALWEALLLSALGVLLGALLALGGAALFGAVIADASAIRFTLAPDTGALWTALLMLGLGTLAGLLPALDAYRTEPAAVLAS